MYVFGQEYTQFKKIMCGWVGWSMDPAADKCGLEKGDAQDRRRWRRMVPNPVLASKPDKGEDEDRVTRDLLFFFRH